MPSICMAYSLLVRRLVLAHSAHDACKHTIMPLMCGLLKGTVQLLIGECEGVEGVHVDLRVAKWVV